MTVLDCNNATEEACKMTQDENTSSDINKATELFAGEEDVPSLFLLSNSGVNYLMPLFKTINEIELPIRANNAFNKANILYVGDLVTTQYKELVSLPDLGRKSLESVRLRLESMGLRFDMDITPWPPVDLEDLRKQYEIKMDMAREVENEIGW